MAARGVGESGGKRILGVRKDEKGGKGVRRQKGAD